MVYLFVMTFFIGCLVLDGYPGEAAFIGGPDLASTLVLAARGLQGRGPRGFWSSQVPTEGREEEMEGGASMTQLEMAGSLAQVLAMLVHASVLPNAFRIPALFPTLADSHS